MQKFMQKAKKFMQTHKKLCGVCSNSKSSLGKKATPETPPKSFLSKPKVFLIIKAASRPVQSVRRRSRSQQACQYL